MLKKAGTVVAVATAGVLALSPLAFATGPYEHGGHSRVDVDNTSIERDNQDLECDFANDQTVSGLGGLLGIDPGLPINATIPLLSCNNVTVNDVIDIGTADQDTTTAGTTD